MDSKGQLIQMPLQRKGYYILDWYQFYPMNNLLEAIIFKTAFCVIRHLS